MPVLLNRLLLEQTSFDSAAPSGLAAVLHRFSDAGHYVVNFVQEERTIAHHPLAVVEAPIKQQVPPEQVRIDLHQLRQPTASRSLKPTAAQAVAPQAGPGILAVGGHALFTSSTKEGSYAIVAEKAADHGKAERFDSRRLGAADVFAVTLIRPGIYSLTNTITGAKGRITVAYPKVGKEPYRPPAPLTVECGEKGFAPAEIDLQPAQGIKFHFGAPGRIKIDLVTPNDGPAKAVEQRARPGVKAEKPTRPVARWTKPG